MVGRATWWSASLRINRKYKNTKTRISEFKRHLNTRYVILWNDFLTVFNNFGVHVILRNITSIPIICVQYLSYFFFTLNKPFDRKFKCVNVIYNKDVYILVDMPWKLFFLVSWEKENKTWSYYFCVSMQLLFSFSSYPS